MDSKGFTLIELMVAVAVFSIVLGIAGYNYYSNIPRIRLNGAATLAYASINRAKSEAVKRGLNITIEFESSDNTYAIQDAAGNIILSGEFSNGVDILDPGNDSGDSSIIFVFDSRGVMINQLNQTVEFSYPLKKTVLKDRRVRVTRTGAISIQVKNKEGEWV